MGFDAGGRSLVIRAPGPGGLLKAQARLGHRDPTTLRHYSHAVPLDDNDVANEVDRLLNDLASEY